MCTEFQHLSYPVLVINGLAYVLTYFIAVVIAAICENDSKLKDLINFGIYCLGLGLGSVTLALALHVSGLGLGLGYDTSGLVNIPVLSER